MCRRLVAFSLIMVLILVAGPELMAQGCAMCKAVAETRPGGNVYGGSQAVGTGLNKGILFLAGVPYVLLFLVFRKHIAGFVKEFRNAKG